MVGKYLLVRSIPLSNSLPHSVCLHKTCLSVWVLEWIISFSASHFIACKTEMMFFTPLSLRIYQENVGKDSQALSSTEK